MELDNFCHWNFRIWTPNIYRLVAEGILVFQMLGDMLGGYFYIARQTVTLEKLPK